MSDVTQLPRSQIIGLCRECIQDIAVPFEEVSGICPECMACDKKREADGKPIGRVRITPTDFARLVEQA